MIIIGSHFLWFLQKFEIFIKKKIKTENWFQKLYHN